MEGRKLKDYETKWLRYLFIFLKLLEALTILIIGILQFIISVDLSFTYYGLDYVGVITTTTTTTTLTTTSSLLSSQFIIEAITLVFTIFFLAFMLNAFADIMERINILVKICTKKYSIAICKLCCIFCLTSAALNKCISTCIQWFSVKECFWRTHANLSKIFFFSLRLLFNLFGLSMMIACLSVSQSTKSTVYSLNIANLLLYIFRIAIMFFMFVYCSNFNPDSTVKPHANHEGYLRLEEMNTSICSAAAKCRTTDLTHILKCHDVLHEPVKDCNPCYILTCRKGFLIGFHQTTLEVALLIANTGFKCGRTGMYGGGIYFARSVDLTDRKALTNGVLICALVDMEKS